MKLWYGLPPPIRLHSFRSSSEGFGVQFARVKLNGLGANELRFVEAQVNIYNTYRLVQLADHHYLGILEN